MNQVEAVAGAIRAAQDRLRPNRIAGDSVFDDAHQMAEAIVAALDAAGHKIEVKQAGCVMCGAGPKFKSRDARKLGWFAVHESPHGPHPASDWGCDDWGCVADGVDLRR